MRGTSPAVTCQTVGTEILTELQYYSRLTVVESAQETH